VEAAKGAGFSGGVSDRARGSPWRVRLSWSRASGPGERAEAWRSFLPFLEKKLKKPIPKPYPTEKNKNIAVKRLKSQGYSKKKSLLNLNFTLLHKRVELFLAGRFFEEEVFLKG
jgi:hypothetical protein